MVAQYVIRMAITARKTAARPKRANVGADDPLAASRVRYLADVLGAARLAEVVGVNRSQPSRWITGEERPGPIAAPVLIDLEHVIARARLVWGETAAATWLGSANSYLDGARPIDVLRLSGAAPVLEALDAETWGGAV
jgi:Protein of unknown function (DUF2384)